MTWYSASYLHKKAITIDHTRVSGGSDLSNFPVLISRTDTDLKTAANGGSVQSSNGYDIIFTDSSEATKLDHEIERYTAATGEIEMWVRIPTLSASVDTVIYLYYDNASISTSQENATGVWDTNFKRVYHLGNGTTLSVADSTSNAANGTNSGATATTGQIDGGASLNGSSNSIAVPTTGLPTAASLTLSAWVNVPINPTSFGAAIGIGTGVGSIELCYRGNAHFAMVANGGTGNAANDAVALTANTTYHLVGVYDGSNLILYKNGVNAVSASLSGYTVTYGNAYIGSNDGSDLFNGWVDEARISNVARSAGWIATEYTNQNAPGTFYSVGGVQTYSVTTSSGLLARLRFALNADSATSGGRGTPNAWSPASSGSNWTQRQGGGTLGYDSTNHELTFTGSSAAAILTLGTQTPLNAEVIARVSADHLADTVGVALRVAAGNTAYRVRLTNGTFSIARVLSGTLTQLASTSASISTNTFYQVKGRVVTADGQIWLYAKWWADGAAEPSTWTLATTDTTAAGITAAGWCGIFVSLNATTDNAKFDSFAFYGAATSADLPLRLGLAKPLDLVTRLRLGLVRDLVTRLLFSKPADTTQRLNAAIDQDTAQSSRSGLPNAWSPASSGSNWQRRIGGGTLGFTGSAITVTGSAGLQLLTLSTSTVTNVEGRVRLSMTNPGNTQGLVFRAGTGNTNYRIRLSGTAFSISRALSGTNTVLASQTISNVQVNTAYFVKGRVVSIGGAVWLYAKYWADGSPEPGQYALTVVDALTPIPTAGWFGVFCSLNSSTETTSFDSFVVYDAFNGADIPLRLAVARPIDLAQRLRVAPARDLGVRLKFSANAARDTASRLRLGKPLDILSRLRFAKPADLALRLGLGKPLDLASRLRFGKPRDLAQRVRIAVARDLSARLRLGKPQDIANRLRFGAFRDLAARLRIAKPLDLTLRLRFDKPTDIVQRLRVALTRDLAARLRVKAQPLTDVWTRLRFGKPADLAQRLRLAQARDFAQRLGLGKPQGVVQRLRLGKSVDILSRLRFAKPLDTALRLRLVPVRDLLSRLRLGKPQDVTSRLRLGAFRDLVQRLRLAVTRDLLSRLRLGLVKDTPGRLRFGKPADLLARVRIIAPGAKDLVSRLKFAETFDWSLRLGFAKPFDLFSRLRLAITRDASMRLRIGRPLDLAVRLRLGRPLNLLSRVRLAPARDLASRLLLRASALRDTASRVRLGKTFDAALRLRLVPPRDLATRLRFGKPFDVASRLRLALTRDLGTRLRFAKPLDLFARLRLGKARDTALRLILFGVSPKDIASRLRLGKPLDTLLRLRLAVTHDQALRLRLSKSLDTLLRIRLGRVRDMFTRLRVAVTRDLASRVRIGSPQDTVTRLRFGWTRDLAQRLRLAQARDFAQRLRLGKPIDQALRLRFARSTDAVLRLRLAKALDIASRLRLGLVRDIAFRLDLAQARNLAQRIRLGRTRDLRARILVAKARDLALRLSLVAVGDTHTRLRFGKSVDQALRVRLQVPMRLVDIVLRVRLQGNPHISDTSLRLRLYDASHAINVTWVGSSGSVNWTGSSGSVGWTGQSGNLIWKAS